MTKTVALSDEAYELLSHAKSEKESFTQAVIKLVSTQKKKSVMSLAGVWKEDEEIRKIFDKLHKERHTLRFRGINL